MSFVLDSSVTMRWFFGDGQPWSLSHAEAVLDVLQSTVARVPVTWRLEVSNVIARAEARGLVAGARGDAFLAGLRELDIEVDDATFSHALSDTLHLARRYNLSACDASHLELALREGFPLATRDDELWKAATTAGVMRLVEA